MRWHIENVFSKTHAVPSGPTPRLASGKPDLSGVWYSQRIVDLGHPELTTWAEKITQERQANDLRDVPSSRCLPWGITFNGLFYPFRIVETARILLIIYEDDLPRQIHLDGRSHPKDWDPTYDGHSVGHWEGDDLVVDTVGFNDRTWLDIAGHPHTENMHLTERFRRSELGHLEIKNHHRRSGRLHQALEHGESFRSRSADGRGRPVRLHGEQPGRPAPGGEVNTVPNFNKELSNYENRIVSLAYDPRTIDHLHVRPPFVSSRVRSEPGSELEARSNY